MRENGVVTHFYHYWVIDALVNSSCGWESVCGTSCTDILTSVVEVGPTLWSPVDGPEDRLGC